MEKVKETSLQTNSIDENVLEFLILLIEADIELQNSSMDYKDT